jgi:predicted DNA-binding WGR domain protein
MSFRSMSSEDAMLTSLCIRLEARYVAHRCVRSYEIELGADLFGAWMVEMGYGRIGALGRTKVRSFSTTEEAQAQVRTCLRKRATAPRRIGVPIACGAWTDARRGCRPSSRTRMARGLPQPATSLG